MIKQFGMEGTFIWFGVVVDVNDPLMLGRARVSVFGEHEGFADEDLPWAFPLLPITSASLNGVGMSPTGLLEGSFVIGLYLDGKEKQKPLMIGTFAKIPNGDLSLHDVSSLARGNAAERATTGIEPVSSYAAQYPYNQVIQTLSGHIIELDDTPGHERINIQHRSGTYTEINELGRRVDKIANEHIEVVVTDKNVLVKGNCVIECEGDMTLKASTINIESDSLKHNGVNIGSDHTHSGVETGPADTGPPNE